MKKTEWFYEPNTNKWWMVSIATNSKELPKITLPKDVKKQKAIIRNINLADDNKKLWYAVLGLVTVLGAVAALAVFLAVS